VVTVLLEYIDLLIIIIIIIISCSYYCVWLFYWVYFDLYSVKCVGIPLLENLFSQNLPTVYYACSFCSLLLQTYYSKNWSEVLKCCINSYTLIAWVRLYDPNIFWTRLYDSNILMQIVLNLCGVKWMCKIREHLWSTTTKLLLECIPTE